MSKVFFGIGAQKAGTTWLHHCLKHHPTVNMPPIKELHFFDEIYEKKGRIVKRLFSKEWEGYRWRKLLIKSIFNLLIFRKRKEYSWIFKFLFIKRNIKATSEYKDLLESLRVKDSLIGEITPAYSILSKEIIRMMDENFPEAKYIYIMRDPVDREWSQSKMKLLRDKKKTVDQYDEKEFMDFFELRNKRTEYDRTLNNWLDVIPKERILIGFYEEIKNEPLEFLNRICDFLEIQHFEEIPISKQYNKGLKMSIPPQTEKFLYAKYENMINELAERFSGLLVNYPQQWKTKMEDRSASQHNQET